MDEEFDALEGCFCAVEQGVLQLLENVEAYLHHLQVGAELLLFPSKVLQPLACAPAEVPGLQNRRV